MNEMSEKDDGVSAEEEARAQALREAAMEARRCGQVLMARTARVRDALEVGEWAKVPELMRRAERAREEALVAAARAGEASAEWQLTIQGG